MLSQAEFQDNLESGAESPKLRVTLANPVQFWENTPFLKAIKRVKALLICNTRALSGVCLCRDPKTGPNQLSTNSIPYHLCGILIIYSRKHNVPQSFSPIEKQHPLGKPVPALKQVNFQKKVLNET